MKDLTYRMRWELYRIEMHSTYLLWLELLEKDGGLKLKSLLNAVGRVWTCA